LYIFTNLIGIDPAAQAAPAGASQPEVFAAGTISTRDDEFAIAFTPDGETAYFTKRSPTTNTPPRSIICETRRVDGVWSEPQVAPFSGTHNDLGVAVSADGRRIVFASDRPTDPPRQEPTVDLWAVDRTGNGWSKPFNLGAPVNTAANEAYPSLAANGTLYFASNRPGGSGASDIWRSRLVDGHYSEPENLDGVNSPGYDSQPAIASDQSYLVFASIGRADTLASAGAPYARSDLYVSFRSAGGWTAPRNLGAGINTPANELAPAFSPDGRWFYFASDRSFVTLPMPRRLSTREYEDGLHGLFNGWGNIYRVPIAALERLRPGAAGGEPPP
jgi:Tol biopolymer transport system component